MMESLLGRGRIRLLTLVSLALAAIAIAAVAAGGAVASPRANDRALKDSIVALEEDVPPALDMDGANAAHPQTQEVLDNIMEPLVTYPTTLKNGILVPNYATPKFAPRLATSYSKNGLVWTFKLRKGVKSCAGNTFSADDVIYTFQRAKSVSGASPVSWFLSNVGGLIGLEPLTSKDPAAKLLKGEVVKVDDYTVKFTQFAPSELFPRVLSIFALYIFDSKEVKAHATTADPWSHKFVDTQNSPGFGPYCLKSWTKGSEVVLSANPAYYLGAATIKTVTIRKVPTSANRVAAIKAGSADVMFPVTPVVYEDLLKTPNVQVLGWQNNNTLSLGMNYKTAPWDGPNSKFLRQAVAFALPYNDIVQQDYKGQARQWFGLVQSIYNAYVPVKTYSTNLAKAKALMVKAGYPGGKGLEKFGAGLTMYYTAERSSVLEPVANRIRTALAAIGIPITLSPISIAEMASRELTKYDLPMWIRDQLQPIGTDAAYALLLFYVSKKSGGLIPSSNEEFAKVDADYAASQKLTGAARDKVLADAQRYLMDQLPMVPILEYPTWVAVRKGVGPLEGRPNNTVTYWNFK